MQKIKLSVNFLTKRTETATTVTMCVQ